MIRILFSVAALLAACIHAPARAAQADATTQTEALDTIVLMEDNVRKLRVGIDLGPAFALGQQTGGLIGGAIVANSAQTAADMSLESILAGAPKDLVGNAIAGAAKRALLRHGMQVGKVLYQDKPKPAHFERFPGAAKAERWVTVEFDSSGDMIQIPVALTPDFQQIRLAMRVTVYAVDDGRSKRLSRRDVALVGMPLGAPSAFVALDRWGENDAERLDRGLRAAMDELIGLALSAEDLGKPAGENDRVDLLTARNAQRIGGRLVWHRDGRALIMNRRGDLLLIPATKVL